MEITAVIPARYQSNRFPGKPLAEIAGEPMIKHVYQRVKDVKGLDSVIVATDDERIYDKVEEFGGRVEMTSSNHTSGTDRIAEVAESLDSDIIVNVQGDEPLIEPIMIEQAVKPFYNNKDLVMGTLKKKIESKNELSDPNIVKVVTDKNNFALYFSRSTIPYKRSSRTSPEKTKISSETLDISPVKPGLSSDEKVRKKTGNTCYKHIGLYVYRRDFLLKFSEMEPTFLEKTESLEQLRALENGYKIKVVETSYNTIGVDEPDDIERVEAMVSTEGISAELK
jgi:3-deoxy-manno-octulosonate cytidylyltransferase (CMP-KDO synthetase)